MNIRIDKDLSETAKGIARNNGISVAKYVNGLLESALNGEIARAKSQALDEKRRKVIDRLWENHKFPKGIKVEYSCGWETCGGDVQMNYERSFYYLEGKEETNTCEGLFCASFKGSSIKPTEVSFRDCEGNDL